MAARHLSFNIHKDLGPLATAIPWHIADSITSLPWSPGTKVTLTDPLPTENLILKNGDPWALELTNAARCILITGALPTLGDDVLNYSCDEGAVASLQTSDDGTISVLYGASDGPLRATAILTAWRGQSYRFGAS